MSKERFSKRTLADDLFLRMQSIQRTHKFNLLNGTSQFKKAKADPVAVAEYGKYRAYESIMNMHGLWDHLSD